MGECFQDVVDFSSVLCHGSGSDAELTVWQTDLKKKPRTVPLWHRSWTNLWLCSDCCRCCCGWRTGWGTSCSWELLLSLCPPPTLSLRLTWSCRTPGRQLLFASWSLPPASFSPPPPSISLLAPPHFFLKIDLKKKKGLRNTSSVLMVQYTTEPKWMTETFLLLSRTVYEHICQIN